MKNRISKLVMQSDSIVILDTELHK